VVDVSALLQLITHLPAWVHVVITFALSIIALFAIAMSVRTKRIHDSARNKTILKLLDDVERLKRANT